MQPARLGSLAPYCLYPLCLYARTHSECATTSLRHCSRLSSTLSRKKYLMSLRHRCIWFEIYAMIFFLVWMKHYPAKSVFHHSNTSSTAHMASTHAHSQLYILHWKYDVMSTRREKRGSSMIHSGLLFKTIILPSFFVTYLDSMGVFA